MKLRSIRQVVNVTIGVVLILQILHSNGKAQERPFETNIVKLNMLPLFIKSYNVSYETNLNQDWSVGIHLNWRPKNDFPYRSKVESYYTDNDIRVRNTSVSQYAITPEFRYYFANGSNMRGFYFSSFFQYARYTGETTVDFT